MRDILEEIDEGYYWTGGPYNQADDTVAQLTWAENMLSKAEDEIIKLRKERRTWFGSGYRNGFSDCDLCLVDKVYTNMIDGQFEMCLQEDEEKANE